MAAIFASLAGTAIVCWTLREVFTDLFQPSESGSLSSFLGKTLFRLTKHARWMLSSAGPLSIVVVIFCWASLVSIGFALVSWARFPEGFARTATESQGGIGRFWTMLYFSLASLTTLGSTTFSPTSQWMRMVSSIESLIGISLLTASITWVVLIYPALGRMRTLTRLVLALRRAQEQTGLDLLAGNTQDFMAQLAQGVLRTRIDFIHFPLIYYFHSDSEGGSLARSLLALDDLATRAFVERKSDETRLGASLLKIALDDLARTLAHKFVRTADANNTRSVFDAVVRDHLEAEWE